MTPAAIRYYIPAFLIASIRHYDDSDQIPSPLLFLLNPFAMNDSNYHSSFRERFDLFDDSQKSATKAFLEYLSEAHPEDFPTGAGKDQASQVLEWWAQDEP